jgi:multidrug efflux pump subunit AcrA (membrane-fusion protein)
MSPEGAKTATFIPDPGMLDSPADLTPVAPELPNMDQLAEEEADVDVPVESQDATPAPAVAKPAETPPPATSPAPRLFDIPFPSSSPAAKAPSATSELQTSPALPAVNPFAPGGAPFAPGGAAPKPAAPSWALDLDGLDGKQKSEAATPGPTALPPSISASLAAKEAGDDGKTPPPAPRPPAPALPGTAAPAPPGLPERRQPPAPDAVQMTAFAPEPAAAPAAKAGANVKKGNAGRVIAVIILLAVIAGVAYVAITREKARIPQAAARVRVFSPKPAAVYRWFSGRGTVTDHESRTLGFESAGMLAELLPPGTAFAAGDIIGRLRAAQPIEALLSRQRARVAFYEQMRDSMRKANNQPELRQAEIKLADKQRLIDEANASLAKVIVRATEPGEVVETLAKVAMPIRANASVVRVKGRMLHGEFALDRDEIARAAKLGFCRVEVIGLGPHASNEEPAPAGTAADVGSPDAQPAPRFVDCTIEKSSGASDKLRVTLPDNLGLVPGQPLRLARERFDAVFPVPVGAIGGADGHRSLWVTTAAGTAERRDITVADTADDALVSDGLRIGDEVIIDAPADLRAGAPISIDR